MTRIIGVSVVSLLPWSLGKKGLARSIRIAHEAGYAGVQALPFKSWDPSSFDSIDRDAVISYEGPWNTGFFSGALRRLFGRAGEEEPTLLDWLLFGSGEKQILGRLVDCFPAALYVVHHKGEDPLEINPEAGLTVADYLSYEPGLVWDTEHVRRPRRDGQGGPVAENWYELWRELDPAQIKLIHFNARGRALKEFLAGEVNDLAIMLHNVAQTTTCPIVVEIPPPVTQKTLVRIRELIEYYCRSNLPD